MKVCPRCDVPFERTVTSCPDNMPGCCVLHYGERCPKCCSNIWINKETTEPTLKWHFFTDRFNMEVIGLLIDGTFYASYDFGQSYVKQIKGKKEREDA